MILDKLSHQVTMLCTAVLFLKFIVTCLIQGGKRFAGGTRPPEDASLSLAKNYKAKQTYGLEKHDNPKHVEADIRWQRIVHNDLENVVPGLIIGWASLFSMGSTLVHVVCMIGFTFGRLYHTYAYAYELQPGRAIGWFVAILSSLIMCINGCVGVLLL